jgi:phosphate acetyltransferase/phosphate butyryltransferase
MDKRDIVQNAIDLAHAIGLLEPKVAILSAQEAVTPRLPSSFDAAVLCKMADRGQITGGVLDGPMGYDVAISETAAKNKRIVSPVAGKAEVLVMPDLEAGTMLVKQLEYMADAQSAGIIVGARVPVIMSVRTEHKMARLGSCALALLSVRNERGVRSSSPEAAQFRD